MGTETILFGFSFTNSKEPWQEREMFMLCMAGSENKIFRSSLSCQDKEVLLVFPWLSMGWVEGALLVALAVPVTRAVP